MGYTTRFNLRTEHDVTSGTAGQHSPARGRLAWLWSSLAALVLLAAGTAGGIAWSLQAPVLHTAEVRLAVGSGDPSEFRVDGFSGAAQELAANYARYVSDDQERQGLLRTLGPAARTVHRVRASPIPNSSIVRLEVVGSDAPLTVKAADAAAADLVREAAGPSRDAQVKVALAAFQADATAVVAARTADGVAHEPIIKLIFSKAPAPVLLAARQAAARADVALEIAQLRQNGSQAKYAALASQTSTASRLRVLRPGLLVSDDKTSRRAFDGVVGFIVGGLLATALGSLRRLSRQRLNRPAGDLVPAPSVLAYEREAVAHS